MFEVAKELGGGRRRAISEWSPKGAQTELTGDAN